MKASDILAINARAQRGLSLHKYLILLQICASADNGMNSSDIAAERWTAPQRQVKDIVLWLKRQNLVTITKDARKGSGRPHHRARATPLAFQFLGIEPETTPAP